MFLMTKFNRIKNINNKSQLTTRTNNQYMSNNIIKVSRNVQNAPKNPVSTHTVAFSHYNNISGLLYFP